MNNGGLWGRIISHFYFLFILSEIFTICATFVIWKKKLIPSPYLIPLPETWVGVVSSLGGGQQPD